MRSLRALTLAGTWLVYRLFLYREAMSYNTVLLQHFDVSFCKTRPDNNARVRSNKAESRLTYAMMVFN
jgi:hypothetical protein